MHNDISQCFALIGCDMQLPLSRVEKSVRTLGSNQLYVILICKFDI